MKQRILIADDDEKVLALLSSSLKKAGYDTSQALNGAGAIELAKQDPPDLILADVAMPEMDGFELCKLIREDPATGKHPIHLLSRQKENYKIESPVSVLEQTIISQNPFIFQK